MRYILILFTLASSIDLAAQTTIGLSLNLGNRQQFTPSSPGFSKALAPSGSAFINQQRTIKDSWVAQYGLTAGVMGYNVKVISIDTLSPSGDISPFTEYTTFFGSIDLLLGRKFPIAEQTFMIGAGGGATFYASTAPYSGYGIHIGSPDDNTTFTLFDALMTAPANRYSLYWKVTLNYDISPRFILGAEYIYHTRPAAQGTYQFFHTKTPQSGSIEVYQRELRIALGYKLRRKGNAT